MKFVKLFVLGPRATPGRTQPNQGVRQYVQSGQGVCPHLTMDLTVDQEKLIFITATNLVPAGFFFLLTVR